MIHPEKGREREREQFISHLLSRGMQHPEMHRRLVCECVRACVWVGGRKFLGMNREGAAEASKREIGF